VKLLPDWSCLDTEPSAMIASLMKEMGYTKVKNCMFQKLTADGPFLAGNEVRWLTTIPRVE
jgi:hypothetical protein